MSSVPAGDLDGHAELGLPLGRGTKLRLLRRVLIRLLWPQLSHQVAINRSLSALAATVERLDFHAQRVDGDLEHHSTVLSRHDSELATKAELDYFALGVREHLTGLQAHADRFDYDALTDRIETTRRQAFARYYEGIALVRNDLAELSREIRELGKLEHAVASMRIRMAQIDMLVDALKKNGAELPSPEQLAGIPGAFDALYPVFESAFRGPEDMIRDRVSVYKADFLSIPSRGPVADLGCGRGEWLEVMKDAGIDAYGVDTNDGYVEQCKEKGLDVRLDDALVHLAKVEPGTLGGVTAIQLVEHIEVNQLIGLIDHAIRALQPGGKLIFETPNPNNLAVGASSFYLDPTHQRPLPPQLLAFLVGCRGMVDVEIRELARAELQQLRLPARQEPWAKDLTPVVETLNDYLFGPQDYAVVGRKP